MKTLLALLLLIPSFAWSDLSEKKIVCIKEYGDNFSFAFFEFEDDSKLKIYSAGADKPLFGVFKLKFRETPREIQVNDYYRFKINRKTLEIYGDFEFRNNECEITTKSHLFYYEELAMKYSKGNLI